MNSISKTIKESQGWADRLHSLLALIPVEPRQAVINDIKSHLLQSQIKVIDAVIEEMKSKKQNGHGCGCYSWDRALNDQISSLKEVKKSIENL